MGVRDKQLLPQAFPAGLNNVAAETDVPSTALRDAVNVDLTEAGKIRRRRGYVQRIDGSAHSLFPTASGYLLAVVDGDLVAYDPDWGDKSIRSGVGDRPISFAEIAGSIYWSNGDIIRRVTGALADAPLWPECPGQPTVAAYASGGLSAGDYQVAITYTDADGRESGSSMAVEVTLTAGQGIQLTNIPLNSSASTVT